MLIRRLYLRDISARLISWTVYHGRELSSRDCVHESTTNSKRSLRISWLSMGIHGSVSAQRSILERVNDRRACRSHFGLEPGKEAVHRVRNSFFPLLSSKRNLCTCIMDSYSNIYAAIAARLDSTYVREDTLQARHRHHRHYYIARNGVALLKVATVTTTTMTTRRHPHPV